jgi:hypothetical protein
VPRLSKQLLTLLFITLITASLPAQKPVDKANAAPAVSALTDQMYFESAQSSSPARFISRGHGYTLFAAPGEITMVFKPAALAHTSASNAVHNRAQLNELALRMRFKDANADAVIEGEQQLAGASNYFIGGPSHWRMNVPHYSRVRYRDLYPGIDLVLYGSGGQLEYDLVVRPGADPGKIALAVEGAEQTRIDASGNLIIRTAFGEVRQPKGVAYLLQRGKKTAVRVAYKNRPDHLIGFAVANHDASATLVIDPVLRYSTIIGGTGFDSALGIAVDSSNHAYITGSAGAADFPTTAGVFQRTANSQVAFVAKFSFDGSSLIYSTFVGGSSGRTLGEGIKVDSAGDAFITGLTESPDFPTTAGAFQSGLRGSNDAFVVKLSPGGAHLLYSTLLGGSAGDLANGIAIDKAGNAFITGSTGSADFPTTPAAVSRTLKGFSDAFLSELNSTGSNLVYSSYIGGSKSESGDAIALDSTGAAYIAGSTDSPDFPVTRGAAQTTFGGGVEAGDFFATKVNPQGTSLVYSTYIGGFGDEGSEGRGGIAVDSAGNAYITGDTFSANFPTTAGAFQRSGACGPFVTKLNATGTAFTYSTRLTGSDGGCEIGHGIVVDAAGNAYVTGTTGSTDFPTQEPFDALLSGPFIDQGQADAFVTKLNPSGTALIWSSYLGGPGTFDEGIAITLDADRNVYMAGTASTGFPTTQNAFQKTANSAEDAFVAKVIPLCRLGSVNPSVTLCAPSGGSTVSSPVKIIAGTRDSAPVKLLQIYIDGKKQYEAPLSAVYVTLNMAAGTHRVTAQALDTSNRIFKTTVNVTVH